MNYDNLQPQNMYCNNCEHKCIGYKGHDRTTRFFCERCGCIMLTEKKGKTTLDIHLTAPPHEELFNN